MRKGVGAELEIYMESLLGPVLSYVHCYQRLGPSL